MTVSTFERKGHIFVHTQNIYSCVTLCRCESGSLHYAFSNRHVHLSVLRRVSSLGRPPSTLHPLSSCSPRSTPRPAVCTRKRRGDGEHVCAMRTGIGVSLFRGGSDVLFHPQRRQSCRTTKTYHTIVSKFAHLLISRSSLLSFFLRSSPPPLSLSRRLLRCLSGGSSLYLFILSRFTSPLPFFHSLLVVLHFSCLLLYFIVAILSLVQSQCPRKGLVVRRRSFPPFRLRAGPEDIG